MHKLFIVGLIVLCSQPSFAQWETRASMGINFVNTPLLNDYLQQSFAYGTEVSSFNSAVEFGVEAGYEFKQYQIGFEYAYEMSSFNYSLILGNYTFAYGLQSPSLMGYYIIKGIGYKFKFGGGVGPRFLSVEKPNPPLNKPQTYSSGGTGVVLRADGSTTIGGNFYAYIAGELRYNFSGKPENNGKAITINSIKEDLKMNSLSAGIKLGVSTNF